MNGTKKKGLTDAELDRLGRAVVRASASSEAEAEAVASQPFLYARLRSRIAAEEERRAAVGGETWLALLGVVWRSVPAMALVAVFAFILFWTSSLNNGANSTTTAASSGVLSDEALMDSEAGIERVVFADRRALSSDEVLATILNEDERGDTR
ncbi:MAG TPA: hypothetical protein VK363_00595 [Pyrinomonadaceae bacterium]|nr:hypothetical protein [Pyrinomonadaceae bacterium]